MKLINPSLSPKKKSSDHTNTSPHTEKNSPHTNTGKDNSHSKGNKIGNTVRKRDMTNIAPESMFKKMEGFSNAQIVAEVRKRRIMIYFDWHTYAFYVTVFIDNSIYVLFDLAVDISLHSI